MTFKDLLLATGVFVVTLLASEGPGPIGDHLTTYGITLAALYTMTLRFPRRTAWVYATLVALIVTVASLAFTASAWPAPAVPALIAFIGMAVAVGDALRSRRAYVAAVEERARRAERTREEEAERRVMEERPHIAREPHDVLAHHIAPINVQAGGAAHLPASRPVPPWSTYDRRTRMRWTSCEPRWINYTAGEVILDVTGTGTCGPHSGNGLIGMCERALSLGGVFHAGPMNDGGFRMHAVLPAPRREP
ncbi:Histidine kinase [Nonomuraea solani]|uniref:histidine kinase n=1 Tax=Nonomuraea solani TaxID=1144553 RepID=A0A1H6CQW6_9ACTN|nr:histidine kinase [Nonomuraea solani]SEG75429.1 Histidine kinase [Nonomuraea solani]